MAKGNAVPTRKSKDDPLKKEMKRIRRRYKIPAKNKKFSPGERDAIEFQVVVLKLAGYSQRQLAAAVGISRAQVSEIVNAPHNQELIVETRLNLAEKVQEFLQLMMPEAAMTIVDVMRTEDDGNLRLKAAADIFDRGGIPKVSRSERKEEHEESVSLKGDDFLDAIRQLPPEMQEQAAQMIENLQALVDGNLTDEESEAQNESSA